MNFTVTMSSALYINDVGRLEMVERWGRAGTFCLNFTELERLI